MGKWFIGAFFTAVSAFIAVQAPTGVAKQAAEVRIDSIDTSGYPQIAATVTVVDAAGRPVVDVPAAGFQATVGDAALPVTAVSGSSDAGVGIGVVLTFDVSGSMAGEAIEQAKAAGKVLLNELGANDEVAIVAFSDNVRLVHPYTQDRGSLMNAIDSLSAGGNTALYDGVVGSVDTIRGGGLPRRAVVLLSDGLDFGGVSKNDRATSIAAAQSVGAPFFVVGLGQSIDQPYLQDLANASRGQLSLAPSPESLRALYESIGSILRHQYLLTIDGSGVARTGSPTLRIQVEHGGVVAAAEAALNLPAPEATPTPVPTARVTPKPEVRNPETPAPTVAPVLEEENGGSNMVPLIAGLSMAAGLAGIGGAVLWQRRRRLAVARADDILLRPFDMHSQKPVFTGTGPAAPPTESAATLQVLTPTAAPPVPIGNSPIELGFTTDCGIVLPKESSHRWERVRVWRREGRFMLHNVSRMGTVTVGGRPAIWVVLEDGDEIQLGNCRLVFRET